MATKIAGKTSSKSLAQLKEEICDIGRRIYNKGFAAGNDKLVAGLGKVKTNVDSGVFGAVQEAAIAALTGDQSCVESMRATYRERRDVLAAGLRRMGLEVTPPRATFYFFVRIAAGTSAMGAPSFQEKSINRAIQ